MCFYICSILKAFYRILPTFVFSLKVDLNNYKPNREWDLLSATVRMHLEDYGDNKTFPWMQYIFVLQRHSSLYEATLGVSALSKNLVLYITRRLLSSRLLSSRLLSNSKLRSRTFAHNLSSIK
jgi:hypothetical protein